MKIIRRMSGFRCQRQIVSTQLTFSCSKSTIKTLEKVVKYVQNSKTPIQLWAYFTPFSSVSIVDFEQVSASWERNVSCGLEFHDSLNTRMSKEFID